MYKGHKLQGGGDEIFVR